MARGEGAVLRRRPFSAWLGAATLSSLGDAVTFFALGWVAAGLGPGTASLVLTMESVPLCLLILAGGVLVDRVGARRTMIVCDAAMAVVMAALALGSTVGVAWWGLVAVALLSGTAAALRRPAEGAFPRLFAAERDELARRMAAVASALQVARMAGPTLGGLLVGIGGLPATAALDAATFVVVLAVLVAVRPPYEEQRGEHTAGGGWSAVAEALRAARRSPGVPDLLLVVAGLAATVLPLLMLCVPLAGREAGWGATGTGVVSAGWLLGGLLVTLTVTRRGAPGARLAAAGPVIAVAAVALLAITDERSLAVFATTSVGVGTTLLTAHLLPTFVAASPDAMVGRFQALAGLAQTGPVLVATPLLGAVAATLGVRAALVAVAVGLALTALLAVRVTARLAVPSLSGERLG